MGKGDQKSRRGKIINGTFGVRRRRKKDDKSESKPELTIKEKKAAKEAPAVKEKPEAAEKAKKEPRPRKEAAASPKEVKAKK